MEERVDFIPVDLGDNAFMLVEARVPESGEAEVASLEQTLDAVTDAVQKVGAGLVQAMKAVGPTKFNIELGFALTVKEGKLVALLVNGTATANIKVTLEWTRTAALAPAAAPAASTP